MATLPRLHAVTDDRLIGEGRIVERARAMAEAAGPSLAVHLRTQALGGAAFVALAREVGAATAPLASWLVVNERADAARAVGAHAIVVGRGGLAVRDLHRVAPGLPVGKSVHDAAEAGAAAAEGADFLIAGAVFETPSHPGRAPAGLDVVRQAAMLGRPVIGIGGVTPQRTGAVLDAGAWGVAAIRALWDAPDPGGAARAFLAALPPPSTLRLVVNGEPRTVPAGTTLSGLLEQLGLDPRAVVVEHNRRIVRREQLASATVAAGDAIELVHFVGGG